MNAGCELCAGLGPGRDQAGLRGGCQPAHRLRAPGERQWSFGLGLGWLHAETGKSRVSLTEAGGRVDPRGKERYGGWEQNSMLRGVCYLSHRFMGDTAAKKKKETGHLS